MSLLSLPFATLALTVCNEPAELSCQKFIPIENEVSPSEMVIFPDEILKVSERLQSKVSESPSLVGSTATVTSRIAGTDAYTVANGKLLVWFERHDTMESAILREKQIKAGIRKAKLKLIGSNSLTWRDLFEDIAQ